MAKRTSTMAATLKAAKKIIGTKRTSTMAATLATASEGFKTKKKATKTRTMAETIKAAAPAPKKSKKVSKKALKKVSKKAKGAKKSAAKKTGKGKKKWITHDPVNPLNLKLFITPLLTKVSDTSLSLFPFPTDRFFASALTLLYRGIPYSKKDPLGGPRLKLPLLDHPRLLKESPKIQQTC